ncbi:hypothetical protein UFOVP496_2 [uncultured Caudovirales phage]|uniref:Uncharacterized protein n=1 Tax=uncultured Caudovirales phage TaxID=2100421 RepID=A0A6J5MJJ2_9CAUD|nr:hypothetical protein UFOVP496_2 [uncultured Caudovirales phage]
MTISNPDIVTVLRQRIDQCRCLGAVPATRCCGGCEHDGRCLTEIVCLRTDLCEAIRERDDARRQVCRQMLLRGVVFHRQGATSVAVTKESEVATMMDWDCYKEETP